MKVSYQWLQSYFDAELPSPEEVARVLTFHAFEIDSVTGAEGDTVIDADVLPNRSSDCLSHRGIARELSTLLALPLRDDPLAKEAPKAVPDSNLLDVSVENPELCRRFSAVVVNNVSVGPSPEWLVKRLEALGQKSINNIVDATNYVMFDLGQPLHAFDRDKLTERDGGVSIAVRVGKKGETITALSRLSNGQAGEEYEVGEKNLLIADGNSGEALGIAGVKGGKRAEIDRETKNIVIEAANFDYVSVRKTSQALRLVTDASVRFQNEPSPELTLYALSEAIKLIGGDVEGFVDHYPDPVVVTPVAVSVVEINTFLGTSVDEDEVEDIFKRFGFVYEKQNGVFVVAPPFERTDITIKEDLIEEVGRVYGYEHIDSEALPPPLQKPSINKKFYYAEAVRAFLTRNGFSEVMTHSLSPEGEVELENALAADRPFVRSSLIPGLRDALILNTHNAPLLGLDTVRIFEIGTVFTKGEKEHTALGIAVSDKGGAEAEEMMKELTEHLGVEVPSICQDGVCEANFGDLLEGLPEPETYASHAKEKIVTKFTPISPYPFVLRDIAVWAPETLPAEEIEGVIRGENGALLKTISLFDEYKKDGRVSYAFRLVFQSDEKTLTDTEVGQLMKEIEVTLRKRNFEVR